MLCLLCVFEPCTQGAVGLAIWVPSVTNQAKESDTPESRSSARGYSSITPVEDNDEGNWRQTNGRDGLELSVVGNDVDLEAMDEELLLENLKVEDTFFLFPLESFFFLGVKFHLES